MWAVRAALRLQPPTLAVWPPGTRATGEPQCALCHRQPASPVVHLLHDCRKLPADTLAERADLTKTRAFGVAYASERPPLKPGLATVTAQKRSASFTWEGRSHQTARLLWLTGRRLVTVATRLPLLTRRPPRAVRDALCRPLKSGHAAFPPCAAGGEPQGVLFRIVLYRRYARGVT
jgi:hypothetical protein